MLQKKLILSTFFWLVSKLSMFLFFYFVRILPVFIMYISLILPTEIWEIILDCLSSQGLLNFQHTCHAWREIVLTYIINGRLKNRSFVRGPFVSFKQLHQVTILCTTYIRVKPTFCPNSNQDIG